MIALAATLLAFAPPLDHPLRYRTIETRPLPGGGARHSTLDQEARFTRDGDGYALTLRAVGWSTDAGGAERRRLEAGMAAMLGVPLVFRISADGVATGVLDGDANWRAFVAGLRAAAALPGADGTERALADAMAALPRADRDAQLLESADDVVPRDRDGGRHRHVETDRAQPGGAVLHIVDDIDTSPESGLVVRRHRVRRIVPADGGPPIDFGETDLALTGY